jgi:hypothetical protein
MPIARQSGALPLEYAASYSLLGRRGQAGAAGLQLRQELCELEPCVVHVMLVSVDQPHVDWLDSEWRCGCVPCDLCWMAPCWCLLHGMGACWTVRQLSWMHISVAGLSCCARGVWCCWCWWPPPHTSTWPLCTSLGW